MSHSIIESIRSEDPSYDPIPYALERAKISEPLYRFARNYIFADGYYGPYTIRDMYQEAGRVERDLTLKDAKRIRSRDDALAILRSVAEEIEDYRDTVFYSCREVGCEAEDCAEEHTDEETTAEARDIVNDLFAFVREIYGSSILSL